MLNCLIIQFTKFHSIFLYMHNLHKISKYYFGIFLIPSLWISAVGRQCQYARMFTLIVSVFSDHFYLWLTKIWQFESEKFHHNVYSRIVQNTILVSLSCIVVQSVRPSRSWNILPPRNILQRVQVLQKDLVLRRSQKHQSQCFGRLVFHNIFLWIKVF